LQIRPILSALAIAAAGILAASVASPIGLKDGEGCVSSKANPYVGTYRWRGAPTAEPVRFWFERTEAAGDNVLKANGRGIYLSKPPVNIRIRATIDLKTRRIEIWESNPDRLSFLTNGSHVGTISSDRCRILAVWTTKGTGQQGDLVLEMTPK
jgi:hypothetical protein